MARNHGVFNLEDHRLMTSILLKVAGWQSFGWIGSMVMSKR